MPKVDDGQEIKFPDSLKEHFCILKMQNIFKTQNCSQLRATIKYRDPCF